MKKLNWGNGLIGIFILLLLMHLLVLLRIIPYEILWGGQVTTVSAMMQYELLAVAILLIFLFIVACKTGYIKTRRKRLVNVGMWVIVIYFILNTVGNLASGVTLEKLIFTPISIIIAGFALILALKIENQS